MSTLLKQKQEEIDGLLLKANEIYEAIGQNEPTTDQKKSVIDINKEIEEKEHAFLELEAMEKGREAVTKRLADMRKPVDRGDQRYKGAEPEQKADPRTLGDAVLGDEGFKQWLGSVKNGNTIRQGQFGNSPAVEVKALITGASSTSAGAFVRTDYDSDVNLPYRTLNIRDIITVGQTDSDLVEFVRMVSRDNQAAPVAEATATSGGTGVKPESDLVLEVVQAPVKTIATWLAATRRALADAGQLRTLIDNELRYMVQEELEDQIVAGSGTGENFTGLFNTTGTQTQAWDTDILTTTRKARTKVQVVGRATPNAYLLNPYDWQTIDLLKDAENRYYFGGPTVMGNPRLWGLPVVENEAVTQGEGMVGDFRVATLWDRQSTQIYVTDSHSDFFIRNLIAILAELRAAFGVKRPAALVEMDLTA
jgi:HK97 family phage major capsid protein